MLRLHLLIMLLSCNFIFAEAPKVIVHNKLIFKIKSEVYDTADFVEYNQRIQSLYCLLPDVSFFEFLKPIVNSEKPLDFNNLKNDRVRLITMIKVLKIAYYVKLQGKSYNKKNFEKLKTFARKIDCPFFSDSKMEEILLAYQYIESRYNYDGIIVEEKEIVEARKKSKKKPNHETNAEIKKRLKIEKSIANINIFYSTISGQISEEQFF